MKKAFVAFLLLALMSISLVAQIPDGYYNNANGKTGDALKVALHDIIKDHDAVSYNGLLNAFAYTDCKPNGKIWDIYSNYEYSLNQNGSSFPAEGAGWNREHTWPQSWFNEQTTPRCDLFHVYPTDGYVNNRRGNYPYGEVNNPIYTSGNGSKLGPCVTSGYSGTVFEPIDEYKGDIARSYFYMSVRYYSEDLGWSTSDMTNKSEILPWAMTMLLRWSDEDPVSDKETARNNAVYGYQNNRNPFIDHPEYAHMIWDPNWSGMPYAITCATGLSNGSISAPSQAVGGTIVTLTATPNPGYELDTWTVTKADDSNVTISVGVNNTFVMPNYAVNVSATFKVNNALYDITQGVMSHGSITVSTNQAKSGTIINMTATPDSGYSLYAWYVYKTDDINTHVAVSTTGTNAGSFVMPAYDVTVLASFAQGSGGDYEKVTSIADVTSGSDYLIVCEANNLAFNGTVASGWGRCTGVTITNHTIESNSTTNGYKVVITSSGGGYTFLLPSGKYMSWTSRDFEESTNAVSYAISIANGTARISNNSYILQYNSNSGNGGLRSYTNTNQTAIQLYKKTSGSASTPTHTIHFDSNGGQGSMGDQTVNEFEPTALNSNTFTRQGYAFDSWNTATNGSGTTYFDGATVSLLGDLTLYAQWAKTYPVSLAQVENGSISTGGVTEAVEGAEVTLTATPNPGYEFEYWLVTTDNESVEVEGNSFIMPGCAVTVSAVFVYVGAFAQQYYLVTSTDQLVADRTYLIVNSGTTGAAKALSTTQNNNNRGATDVSISAENGWPIIASIANTNACELTLGGQSGAWTFYDAGYTNNNETGGYLYAASSSNNYLRTQHTNNANGRWTISIASNGKATITAQGTNEHNLLQYNSQSTIFSCYASSQQDVYLFIKGKEFDHPQSESITHLLPSDKHTVHSGATLTVTGTATNVNPSHIILKDGAQLVHYDDNVQATIKKTIVAYTPGTKNGWHLIGYSFAGNGAVDEMDNLLANEYDLYYYDESTHYWMNQELAANSFTELEAAKGYLYANSQAQTIGLKGTLKTANATVNVPLDYTETAGRLKGFNLVGNPFAHNVTTYTGTNVAANCYRMNGNGTDLMVDIINGSNPLKPGEGFFVKATDAEASITFNPGAKDGAKAPELVEWPVIQLDLIQNGLTLDRLIVKREGDPMEKLTLRENGTKLFALRDNQEMAVVPIEGKEQPVSFKAVENGSYTISATTDDCFSYLHLIDHKTGADVDLLALRQAQESACYTFEASKDDYATRFMLAFAPTDGPSTGSEAFAYWADGEIRLIIEAQDFAFLQVIDMMGRIIRCGDGVHTVSTSGMTPGVYVLRLVTDDNVRVQKIVVK